MQPEGNRDASQFKILDGVSVFFNPGEMVGIMGPSGCGKTTFLDLLTGRRKTGTVKVCMIIKFWFVVYCVSDVASDQLGIQLLEE